MVPAMWIWEMGSSSPRVGVKKDSAARIAAIGISEFADHVDLLMAQIILIIRMGLRGFPRVGPGQLVRGHGLSLLVKDHKFKYGA